MIDQPPQIDLPVQAVVCPAHGEVFRLGWPAGYPLFAVTAAVKALETSAEIAEATGGDASKLNTVIAEYGPLCRLLTPELRHECYLEAAKSENWGERGVCSACGKWRLGARGIFRTPVGDVERHVCIECVSRWECQ
jgi:hypothetical protein